MDSRVFQTLVLATHNKGKIAELRELFGSLAQDFRDAAELGLSSPEETGVNFLENALIKARFAAEKSGRPAVADDSGLVVYGLDGEPGVHSARYGGPVRDFGQAMERIWTALAGHPDRGAAMVTALAIARPDGRALVRQGRVEGTLVWPPRGEIGFGYEPFFVPQGASATYGEMDRARKHLDDPRARAFRQLWVEHEVLSHLANAQSQ